MRPALVASALVVLIAATGCGGSEPAADGPVVTKTFGVEDSYTVTAVPASAAPTARPSP